jgi:flavin reductase (DIM6/NTAB) family NADH-FMN oxidoreductase RutF
MKQVNLSEIVYCTPPHAVGVISSLNKEGDINLATFEQVMYISKDPAKIIVGITKDSTTHKNIMKNKEFVLFFPTIDYAEDSYIVGCDKKNTARFNMIESQKVQPMSANEASVNLECELDKIVDELGDHILLVANVINITAQDEIADQNKKLRRGNLNPAYYVSGGTFFEAGKKKEIKL